MPTECERIQLSFWPCTPCSLPLLIPILCCHGSVVVLGRNGFVGHIVVCPTGYVNKPKLVLHVGGHALGVDVQFFPDVFLKCGPFPASHFLDLCVRVPCKSQCIGPSTPQRMSVDAVSREAVGGLAQDTGGGFQGCTNMFVRNVQLGPFS